jgi:hypothetical protein
VAHAAALEKMAATLNALAAARVAETKVWKNNGDRSPAHALARTTGSTVVEAARVLETGRRLEALPEVAAAARRGELSSAQAAAVAEAASAAPSSEARLLAQAGARLSKSSWRSALGQEPLLPLTWRPGEAASKP